MRRFAWLLGLIFCTAATVQAEDNYFSSANLDVPDEFPQSVVAQTSFDQQPCSDGSCQSYYNPGPSKSVWDTLNRTSHNFNSALGRLFGNDELFPAYTAWQYKGGNQRVLGDGQIMVPLWQTCDSLLFADIRGQMDDNESYEGNWGLAYRTITSNDVIFSAYGFYDLRQSTNRNTFSQGTFGVELMTVAWEARMNGYIPETGPKAAPGFTTAQIANGLIFVRAGEERAYYGLDSEVGALLTDWNCGNRELRGFIGGYWFDNNAAGFRSVAGPRLRMEYRAYDLAWFGVGSRLTLGVEYQWDQVRDNQVFGMARLRIPLGRANRARPLSRLERRMLDRIVRDVDIVSQAASGSPEEAINPQTGKPFGPVQFVDANGNLQTTITNAGQNSTVIVNGAAGQINPGSTIQLQPGQTILGGGTSLQVQGINTGTMATLNVPGTKPVINQSNTGIDVIQLADNTAIYGTTIQGGQDGISAENGQQGKIIIQNNCIQNTGEDGIYIEVGDGDSLEAHIQGNQFVNISDSGVEANVYNGGMLDLSNSIVGNTFMSMSTAVYLEIDEGGTINSSIRDNTVSDVDTGFALYLDDGGTFTSTITNNTITNVGNIGIDQYVYSAGTMTSTITNNMISEVDGDAIQLGSEDGGTMTTTVANNSFLNVNDIGVDIYVEDQDSGNVVQETTVMNNTFTDIGYAGVTVGNYASNNRGSVSQTATITGNTFLRNGTGVELYYSSSDPDYGSFISNTTISNNIFKEIDGDGVRMGLGVSDNDDEWYAENATFNLTINNNQFMTIGSDGVFLYLDNVHDASVVVNPTITNNTFTGVSDENILIEAYGDFDVNGVITGNTATGGEYGLDIYTDNFTNMFTIGGNTFISQSTGIDIENDSADTTILGNGMDNVVSDADSDFIINNVSGQILINGSLEP